MDLARQLDGHVDILHASRLAGWFADREKPDKAVEVEFLLDGCSVATGLADAFREGKQRVRRRPAVPGAAGLGRS